MLVLAIVKCASKNPMSKRRGSSRASLLVHHIAYRGHDETRREPFVPPSSSSHLRPRITIIGDQGSITYINGKPVARFRKGLYTEMGNRSKSREWQTFSSEKNVIERRALWSDGGKLQGWVKEKVRTREREGERKRQGQEREGREGGATPKGELPITGPTAGETPVSPFTIALYCPSSSFSFTKRVETLPRSLAGQLVHCLYSTSSGGCPPWGRCRGTFFLHVIYFLLFFFSLSGFPIWSFEGAGCLYRDYYARDGQSAHAHGPPGEGPKLPSGTPIRIHDLCRNPLRIDRKSVV